MKPAAGEGLARGGRILQIALHHHIAADHDLAHGLRVLRYRLHGHGVGDHQVLKHVVGHALARLLLRARLVGQVVPFVVPGAHHGRSVGFRETVDMGDLETVRFHLLQHGGRRRGRGGHHLDLARQRTPLFRLGVDHHIEDHGRAAKMRHSFLVDGAEDLRRFNPAQTDTGSGLGRERPGKAPAVAVEHRQRPKIARMHTHVPGQHVAEGEQIGASVMIDDAFRIARGPRGVIQRNGVPFVVRQFPVVIRIAAGDEVLVFDIAETLAARTRRVVDIDDIGLRLAEGQRFLHDRREFGVGDHRLRLAMIEDEGDGGGVETGVDRVQHRAGHRHAEMRVVDRRDIGREAGDGVVLGDAARGEPAGELAGAVVGFRVAVAHIAMDHRRVVGIDGGAAAQEGQRAQRHVIGRVLAEIVFVFVRHGVASRYSGDL